MQTIMLKLLILIFGLGLYIVFHTEIKPLENSGYVLPEKNSKDNRAFFEQTWVSSGETSEVHSASIACSRACLPPFEHTISFGAYAVPLLVVR